MRSIQLLGNSAFGGATRLVLDWCEYLEKAGCSVDILTTDQRSISVFGKIAYVNVRSDILIPREIDFLKDLKAIIKLTLELRREKYQVIHTYSATPSIIGRVAGFLAGTPVILHHQAGWTVNEARSPLGKLIFQFLEAFAITLSTKSICVSHAVRKQADTLPLIPKSKLVTICNGIDPDRFMNLEKKTNRLSFCNEFNIPFDSVLIGNTGRLAKQKDNATLIKAIAELRSYCPGKKFYLLLAGDGPDRQDLENLANSLEISQEVIFLGFRSDIPNFLSALDIFVSPSLWEGLSISIMEAMAAGCPIVATSILPNAELIENQVTGLLVPEKSPVDISNAVIYLLENPDIAKRLGQEAQARVQKEYSLERMFSETFNLYKGLPI